MWQQIGEMASERKPDQRTRRHFLCNRTSDGWAEVWCSLRQSCALNFPPCVLNWCRMAHQSSQVTSDVNQPRPGRPSLPSLMFHNLLTAAYWSRERCVIIGIMGLLGSSFFHKQGGSLVFVLLSVYSWLTSPPRMIVLCNGSAGRLG